MTNLEEIPDFAGMTNLEILELVVEIASKAGMEAELRNLSGEETDADPDYVVVVFPDGAKGRRSIFDADDAQNLIRANFQHFCFVPELQATFDSKSDIVEARIVPIGDVGMGTQIWRIPGAEILEDGQNSENLNSLEEFDVFSDEISDRPKKWRLRVNDGSKYIEISPIQSRLFFQHSIRLESLTIKLVGFGVSDMYRASEILQSVGNAFLFELDVVHGLAMGLLRYRPVSIRRSPTLGEKNAEYPKNIYSKEALTLYQYGRSARQLPLLQFLAYYQSLEYFFPIFARSETVSTLRTALLDPRLNPTKDEDVNRLINISITEMKANQRERDQLGATIRGCTTEEQLKTFIESSKVYRDHFCSNSQKISKDLKIVLENPQLPLADQVATRIYKIRCRVVHTKQDSNGDDGDLLLPFSPEVESLKIDIELMRFLAQQALFAKASRIAK